MDAMYIEAGLALAVVFLLTVVLARIIIPILKSHKAGVRILEIGPRWHKSKEGTPIMGGICFILAILISVPSNLKPFGQQPGQGCHQGRFCLACFMFYTGFPFCL